MSKLKQAIEKAKAAEGPAPKAAERETEAISTGSQPVPPPQPKVEREEINPAYCQTRVVKTNRRFMRSQRVVSLCYGEGQSDQMKILQTQVLTQMEAIHGNTLLVTSMNPSEGKTLTGINLAMSMSHRLDRTVLLVDAHLRSPTIHSYLGLPAHIGLSEYLLREAEIQDVLINPGMERLVLLPAGKRLTNSAELLGSPRMEALVKEMKTRYPDRFLIFDCSSLLTGADALLLGRFMDGVLLVVEAEKTSARDLERGLELLRGMKIIGTVLNKAKDN